MDDLNLDRGFAWDPEKSASNKRKHGVDFTAAARAFQDPHRALSKSNRPHIPEERYLLVGASAGDIIAVVFTFRADQIRIISARRASRDERREYSKSSAAT